MNFIVYINKNMKLSTWAKKQGVHYNTAYKWFKEGKFPVVNILFLMPLLLKLFNGTGMDDIGIFLGFFLGPWAIL